MASSLETDRRAFSWPPPFNLACDHQSFLWRANEGEEEGTEDDEDAEMAGATEHLDAEHAPDDLEDATEDQQNIK